MEAALILFFIVRALDSTIRTSWDVLVSFGFLPYKTAKGTTKSKVVSMLRNQHQSLKSTTQPEKEEMSSTLQKQNQDENEPTSVAPIAVYTLLPLSS